MKTCIVLFVIGILLSTTTWLTAASSEDAIVLTEKNHIVFSGQVSDASVAAAQVQLGKISSNLGRNEVIYLVIDSPGGSVSAGNQFIDFAQSLPQKIKPICIFCASMGYHMFQSFGERLVTPSSTLMSHRASLGGLSGQVPGELETRLSAIKDTLNQMDASVAKRVGTSVEAYQKLIYDELWLNGRSAVAIKHADRLAKIKCDNELLVGKKVEEFMTPFGPVEATLSSCPLISGILDVKFKQEHFRSEKEARSLVRQVKRSVMWGF